MGLFTVKNNYKVVVIILSPNFHQPITLEFIFIKKQLGAIQQGANFLV